MTRGDYERVRSLGDQARDALGRALSRGRDRSSLDDYIDRARDVRRRLAGGDTDDFDRPNALRRHLDHLLDETDVALSRGADATAGRRAVDAHELTHRSRARCHDVDPEKGARLVVAMAVQTVDLANGLLDSIEIDERTQHLLDTAARLAASSAEAWQSGHFRQAIILGHKAVSVSFMAVIRPDKVTDVEFQANEPKQASPWMENAVISELVLANAPKESVFDWLLRPRTIRLSPCTGLAMAVAATVLVVFLPDDAPVITAPARPIPTGSDPTRDRVSG